MNVIGESTGRLVRVWTAACDRSTHFSSIAKTNSGIAFARVDGVTTAHLRGPESKATMWLCPRDTEYFGADFRLGIYLPRYPPARLANLRDAVLPTLPNGQILLGGQAWEMPTPQNVDVFLDRLARAGLVVFDPLVEELWRDNGVGTIPERTAQSRMVRAVGLSRRKLQQIERARHAAHLLRAGASIADVVTQAGYYDQPHLTRAVRQLIGYTPAELVRGGQFLAL